jgi:hypothetical protein
MKIVEKQIYIKGFFAAGASIGVVASRRAFSHQH